MKALTFDDVLLIPKYSEILSRKDVDLFNRDKKNVFNLDLPIISSNMDTITESKMINFMWSYGAVGALHRFMSIEKNIEEFKKSPMGIVSIGVNKNEIERFEALKDAGANVFCIDVAHGHSIQMKNMIQEMRNKNPYIVIIAGNVCTVNATLDLADWGADMVKVGIGPGSSCTTRIKTGFGIPQLKAINDCAGQYKVSIIADGGIKTPGDIVKALAFGADFVMLGGMLAGTHHTPGEILYRQNAPPYNNTFGSYKTYRGMASKEVADEYLGGMSEWKTAEGKSFQVPYKDEDQTKAIMQDIIGGIRSGLTYCGAHNIKELQEKMEYVEITSNTVIENQPHMIYNKS